MIATSGTPRASPQPNPKEPTTTPPHLPNAAVRSRRAGCILLSMRARLALVPGLMASYASALHAAIPPSSPPVHPMPPSPPPPPPTMPPLPPSPPPPSPDFNDQLFNATLVLIIVGLVVMVPVGVGIYNLMTGGKCKHVYKPTQGDKLWCICCVMDLDAPPKQKGGNVSKPASPAKVSPSPIAEAAQAMRQDSMYMSTSGGGGGVAS